MDMNPEWNASYLRQPAMPTFAPSGYGAGVSAGDIYGIGAGLSAIGGVVTAVTTLKGQREQAVADEKMARLQAKQQRESDISTQNMMTISLLQQQEAAKGRASTTKTVITGLGVVAVLAVLGFVAVQMLKQPSN
jgi:hypothetical protein